MFRITSRVEDDDFVLKVEGCLTGAGVEALDGCWRETAQWPWHGRMRVDLTDVCHVDAAGQALMTTMYRAGIRFVTRGCVMPEIVRQIKEAAEAPRRS